MLRIKSGLKVFLPAILLLAQAMAGPGNAGAAGTNLADELTSQSQPQGATAGDLVDAKFDEFKQKYGIEFGAEGNEGKIYYANKAAVSVEPTSPQWGKARFNAFDNALLAAQTDFVIDMFGKQTVKKIQDVFSDQSDNAEEFKDPEKTADRFEALFNKLIALKDAVLNEKLAQLGIDPEKFSAMPPEQKKVTFNKTLTKTILTRAIGEIAGLVPVQTYEGRDSKGNHVIGVIVMYSPKMKQLASDIASKRTPFLKSGKGAPLREVITGDPATLANQFGVRCMFNENGRPCLVSFGQWSHNYTGENERKKERMRIEAADNALDEANAAIAMFLNGNMMFERERQKGEATEDSLTKSPDGMIRRKEDFTTIIDKMCSHLRQQASMDLGGTSTLKKWRYAHPYGQEIIGVVRVWSMDTANVVNGVRNFDPNKDSSREADRERKVKSEPGVSEGKEFMNPNDF